MCCQLVNRHRKVSWVLGISTIVISLVVYFASDKVFNELVRTNMVLREDSFVYDVWKNVPAQIYYEVYMFNLTNGDQVMSSGDKPRFDEVGPYVFSERRHKENITFHSNGTVSYRQRKTYHFVPHRSQTVSLTDPIVHLNFGIIGADFVVRNKYSGKELLVWYQMLNNICDDNPLAECSVTQVHNVLDLLFEGYYDPFIEGARFLFQFPDNRFGYFLNRNDTTFEGIYSIFSGDKGIDRLGLIDLWNMNSEINQYQAHSKCNKLNYATAGDLTPPFEKMDSSDPVYLFTGDLCRSFRLDSTGEVKVDGIKSKRYMADDRLFDYSLDDNKCFCQSAASCPAKGVANLSRCAWNAPVFISFPHFLHADHQYLDSIVGMRPDPQKHVFYADYEPRLGIPLRGNAVIQINVLVEKDQDFHPLSKLHQNKVFWPQIWFRISIELDDDQMNKVYLAVTVMPIVIDVFSLLLLISGLLILIPVIYFQFWNKYDHSYGLYHANSK